MSPVCIPGLSLLWSKPCGFDMSEAVQHNTY
jgi:hypothetical protein